MIVQQFDVKMVREWIYTKGFSIGGAQIEKVLGPTVPDQVMSQASIFETLALINNKKYLEIVAYSE